MEIGEVRNYCTQTREDCAKNAECVYEIHAAVVDSLQAPVIKMKNFVCSFSLSFHKHVYVAINEQIF